VRGRKRGANRRGAARAGVSGREQACAQRLDETSIFNHDSAKTCEGSQNPSGGRMGLACGPF